MKIMTLCAITGLAVGLPFAGSAQQTSGGTAADIKYCNALASSYERMWSKQQAMPASDVVTLSRCASDPRTTIAVLEKKLTDKRVALPHDDRVAQPPGSTRSTQ